MLKNWTEESKQKDIDKLLELAKGEKNPIKRAYIMQVIDKTRRNFESEKMGDFVLKKTYNQLLIDLLEEFIGQQRYYALLYKFSELFEEYEMVIQTNVETLNSIDTNSYEKNLSDSEAFTLVHDFFMDTDDTFSKLFSKYINDKYTTIKFSKDEPLLNEYNCDGLDFFIDILHKNYILVRDKDGYYKSSILAHEIGHALSFLYEPKSHYTYQNTFLNELPSLFFELAFNNDVVGKLCSMSSAEHALSSLENRIGDTEYILLHELIIDEWKANEYKANNDFYRNIKYGHGLGKSAVLKAIHTSIIDDGEYIFSYMLALHLLNIYRQDKKEALKMLRCILKSYNEDSLITINTVLPNMNGIRSEIDLINTNFEKEVVKLLTK